MLLTEKSPGKPERQKRKSRAFARHFITESLKNEVIEL
jgi:hypothetical protein